MELTPLYESHNLNPAYRLIYNWTGWIDDSSSLPGNISENLSSISPYWEKDGIRLLEHRVKNNAIFATVSAKPFLSPILICSRLKGRIQHSGRGDFGKLPPWDCPTGSGDWRPDKRATTHMPLLRAYPAQWILLFNFQESGKRCDCLNGILPDNYRIFKSDSAPFGIIKSGFNRDDISYF